MLSQSKTGGTYFNLTFKIGARVMLTSNVDISEKLINGQIGIVAHVSSHEGMLKRYMLILMREMQMKRLYLFKIVMQ